MIDELLDTSRISQGKVSLRTERLDLVALVRQAVADHRYALDRNGLSLALELPDTKVAVQADAVRLSQVIGNLLHNAAKFTDCHGRVSVSLRVSDNGRQATVAVSDTGIGMEPATIINMFEPFTQARTSAGRDGNGLGLGLGSSRAWSNFTAARSRRIVPARAKAQRFLSRCRSINNRTHPSSNPAIKPRRPEPAGCSLSMIVPPYPDR